MVEESLPEDQYSQEAFDDEGRDVIHKLQFVPSQGETKTDLKA